MDANNTRYHLLFGSEDWARTRNGSGEPLADSTGGVRLDDRRHEVTLWQKSFRFGGRAGERIHPTQRRGAARDRFENWYWIDPEQRGVLVLSSGSGNTSGFWPAEEEDQRPAFGGDFQPELRARGPVPLLQGLTVTEDHYLVVGTLEPAGVLVFDLYSGGPPRQLLWEERFAPHDLSPRAGGGVWILDSRHRRLWQLDRRLEVVMEGPALSWTPADDGFCDEAAGAADPPTTRPTAHFDLSWPVPASGDPVAVAGLPGGGALVLEADDGTGYARVHWLKAGAAVGAPVSTRLLERYLERDAKGADPGLVAHDFAFGGIDPEEDPGEWLGRLYVVGRDGNQAFAFGVAIEEEQLALHPIPEFFPMRLFGGRALVTADGEPWYDTGGRWVPLLRQSRPRHSEEGELLSPVFDSDIPGCVWHRVMLDACIPPGAEVEVYTRASDDWRELALPGDLRRAERSALGAPEAAQPGDPLAEAELTAWSREPSPYLRAEGPELPYLPRDSGPDRGTWELLLQSARGRYARVRLVLRGDGRATPRIRAMRVWYPRFSYLDHYLPAVYREDEQSASFLERFLANMEGTFTTIEDRIAAAQLLFDVDSAPPDALQWLATWLGVALDPAWEDDDERRRLFIRNATRFFALRGTTRGLQLALRLALDPCVDEAVFSEPDRAARKSAPVRIIERFRARRTPLALLGDVGTTVQALEPLEAAERWKPSAGGAELNRRYRERFALAPGTELPLSGAGAPPLWSAFVEESLGFVPRAGAEERSGWQAFLAVRYGTIGALNGAHATAHTSFEQIRLPRNRPSGTQRRADWAEYLEKTPRRTRRLFQDFLARRYRAVADLATAWPTSWKYFTSIPVPDRLPPDGAPLADWFLFESTVLPMHATAHRFTVMLPVSRDSRTDTPAQRRRLELAKAVLELEKPAHTIFDVRYYWAMFRLGEARLGSDTLIDLGSRAPELMAPMVLGRNYLAEAYLAPGPGRDAPCRTRVGRDRVGRSTRLGGP